MKSWKWLSCKIIVVENKIYFQFRVSVILHIIRLCNIFLCSVRVYRSCDSSDSAKRFQQNISPPVRIIFYINTLVRVYAYTVFTCEPTSCRLCVNVILLFQNNSICPYFFSLSFFLFLAFILFFLSSRDV